MELLFQLKYRVSYVLDERMLHDVEIQYSERRSSSFHIGLIHKYH